MLFVKVVFESFVLENDYIEFQDFIFFRLVNSFGKLIEVVGDFLDKEFFINIKRIIKLIKIVLEKWLEDYFCEILKLLNVKEKLQYLIGRVCVSCIKEFEYKLCDKEDVVNLFERVEFVLELVCFLLFLDIDEDNVKYLVVGVLLYFLILVIEYEQFNLWILKLLFFLLKEVFRKVKDVFLVSGNEEFLQYQIL